MSARSDRLPVDPPASLLETMRAWSVAHPQATFAEIEVEGTRQVAAVRTALIGAALASRDAAPAPECPACGRTMIRNGTRTRTLTTSHAERVTLTGPRYRCPACGTELFPPR
jgi:YgiT-type zinc finger domain-containing protein